MGLPDFLTDSPMVWLGKEVACHRHWIADENTCVVRPCEVDEEQQIRINRMEKTAMTSNCYACEGKSLNSHLKGAANVDYPNLV